MKKKKILLISALFLSIFIFSVFYSQVLAAGSATVSWIAPTTDEGGGELTGLAGYRVYYSTSEIDCTAWDAASDQTTRQAITLAPNFVNVLEAATLRDLTDATKRGYTFSTTSLLTPGQTYYFTVVAYDSSGNLSQCVNDAGSNKTASKLVYRRGDLNDSGAIDISDLSILAGNIGSTVCRIAGNPSDINGDCLVDISDLSILAGSWGL